ncbi:MAG: hypothetical protein WBX22_02540 [Silvibacterium sp.]
MKRKAAIGLVVLALSAFITRAGAQVSTSPTQTDEPPASPSGAGANKNMQAYVKLLLSHVRQRKAEVMAETMQLNAADAAKFWPIYNEYDAELDKLSDLEVANIAEYARTYTQMTNDKADELIQSALADRRQQSELLEKYYDRVKAQLGAITAARFVQVEDQLLLIIYLQIDSSLPLVGQTDVNVENKVENKVENEEEQ